MAVSDPQGSESSQLSRSVVEGLGCDVGPALQGESWKREGKSGDQVRLRAPEVAWLP